MLYNMTKYESEKYSENLFKTLFDSVKRTEYNSFFDYLCKKGPYQFKIEVKYTNLTGKNNIGYILFYEKRMIKLLSQSDFLLFITTKKGNIFVSPKQIYNYGHLHYNKLNPDTRRIVLKVCEKKGKIFLVHPKKCRNCLGILKDFAIQYGDKKNEKKTEVVSVYPVFT